MPLYGILSSAKRNHLTSPLFYLYAFYFFLLANCSVKISNTMFTKSDKSEHPSLLLDLKGNTFTSPQFNLISVVDLLCIIAFISWYIFLLYLICWEILSSRDIELYWLFSSSMEMIMCLSCVPLIYWFAILCHFTYLYFLLIYTFKIIIYIYLPHKTEIFRT